MDAVVRLVYDVHEPLTSNVRSSKVEIVGFYHYDGLPDYAFAPRALVIAKRFKGRYLKQLVEPVSVDDDGQWWVCDRWSDDPNAKCEVSRNVKEIVGQFTKDT